MTTNQTTLQPKITATDAIWQLILTQSKSVQKELAKRIKTLSVSAREKEISKIPAEFRCDPYTISPSGDPYWADIRNVEALRKAQESAKEKPALVINSKEDLEKLFAI